MIEVQSWSVGGDTKTQNAFDLPIVFLAFNRPEETRIVFDCIRRQKPRRLLIVLDGARQGHPTDADRCADVRSIVTAVDWPCEVSINAATQNLGCGLRISSGLDWVFDTVEEAVILEDDCVPNDDFFNFMAVMLPYYRFDTRVGTVGGTNAVATYDIRLTDSYFFTVYPALWGWGSWRRAWRLYDFHMTLWEQAKTELVIGRTFRDQQILIFFHMVFEQLAQGKMDTWDFQLYFASFSNSWLHAIPAQNLVTNIGYGPDATHPAPPGYDRLPHGSLSWPLRHPKFILHNRIADKLITKLAFGMETTTV